MTFLYNNFWWRLKTIAKWWKYHFLIFLIDQRQPHNLEKRSLTDMQCDLNPQPFYNGLFNCNNCLIKWEYWSEQSSSSFEKYCESYNPFFFELKSIRHSIFWIILSTLSHIYTDWDLTIAQVEDVFLVVTFSVWFFLYWGTRWCFFWGGGGLSYFCNFVFFLGKLIILFLYIWLRKTDGSRLGFIFGS